MSQQMVWQKKVAQSSTLKPGGDWTWYLLVGIRDLTNCANTAHTISLKGFKDSAKDGHYSHLEKSTYTQAHMVNKYLLLAECKVRTASYGPIFFPSFYGPSAKHAGHENKEGKNEDP